MSIALLHMEISHPSNAARLMLEHKRLEFDVVRIRPGTQPPVVLAHGFRGITVPALKIDGARIQGTTAIARELERRFPEPALYPSDPARAARVREAEEWANRELQPVPRHVIRLALREDRAALRSFVGEQQGFKPAGLIAAVQGPVMRAFLGRTGGTRESVERLCRALPEMLDHVDRLIEEGVIGGTERNSADYQIGTTIKMMEAFDDLGAQVEGRPAARLAAVWPELDARFPSTVPAVWLAAGR